MKTKVRRTRGDWGGRGSLCCDNVIWSFGKKSKEKLPRSLQFFLYRCAHATAVPMALTNLSISTACAHTMAPRQRHELYVSGPWIGLGCPSTVTIISHAGGFELAIEIMTITAKGIKAYASTGTKIFCFYCHVLSWYLGYRDAL